MAKFGVLGEFSLSEVDFVTLVVSVILILISVCSGLALLILVFFDLRFCGFGILFPDLGVWVGVSQNFVAICRSRWNFLPRGGFSGICWICVFCFLLSSCSVLGFGSLVFFGLGFWYF